MAPEILDTGVVWMCCSKTSRLVRSSNPPSPPLVVGKSWDADERIVMIHFVFYNRKM